MKIGIDARMITKNVTGAGRVIQTLLEQLVKFADHKFIVFHTAAFSPPVEVPAHIKYVLVDIPTSTLKNMFIAGWKIRSYKLDILYYGFVDVPFFIKTPVTAVVYDLFYMENKGYFAEKGNIRYILIKFFTWWRLKASKSLIAISDTTATQIRQLFLMKSKKIFKIDLCLYKQGQNHIETNHSLPQEIHRDNYILYVGNNRRHKNLKLLIEAFAKSHKLVPTCKLVMCGAKDVRYEDPLVWAKALNIERNVIHLGHVSDALLERLYLECTFVVVPSLYEGFGLPALEAASRRKAVLCSTASALKEVLGTAGIYRSPYDVDGWVDTIKMLLTNSEQREQIAMACYNRSKLYSADRFGRETIEALTATAK